MDQKANSVADVAHVLAMQQRDAEMEANSERAKAAKSTTAQNMSGIPKSKRRKMMKSLNRAVHLESVQVQLEDGSTRLVERPHATRVLTSTGSTIPSIKQNAQFNTGTVKLQSVSETESQLIADETSTESGAKISISFPTSSPATPNTSSIDSKPLSPTDTIRVLWSNISDASYAATWPDSVVHGELEWSAHTFGDEKDGRLSPYIKLQAVGATTKGSENTTATDVALKQATREMVANTDAAAESAKEETKTAKERAGMVQPEKGTLGKWAGKLFR